MTKFNVLILGNASAAPTLSRNQTAQLINIDEQYFLMDCGEGTQLRLREHNIKFQRINHIFISHLHGDHFLGLMGLLQTMHLLGRQTDLHIYSCGHVEEIVHVHLKHAKGNIGYPIHYHTVGTDQSELVFEDHKVEVHSIPLKHKIPCTGFLFREKQKPRKVNPEGLKKYKVPRFEIARIKAGEDFIDAGGNTVPNDALTFAPDASHAYAFCSDTAYLESIIPIIEGVDLLYHEATFLEEHRDRAGQTLHATAAQAATIALKSRVKKLIIGHFSNRYSDLELLLNEAKSIFEATEIAEQDRCFDLLKSQ
ncbi:MAG: ribonuclease Z [Flavobacteriales bacterium]|nr:ribonuclease Z [Flavobacteriales bacterium]